MRSSDTNTIRQIGHLDIHYHGQTGQILRIFDRSLNMEVVSFQPGHELEINKIPLPLELIGQDEEDHFPAWHCNLSGVCYTGIGTAWEFDIFRQVVVGSAVNPSGNHINPINSLHIRYRLDRRQVGSYRTPDPLSSGKRPIQAPLWLDTLGTLCGKTEWFGPETKMIAAHFPGFGPRSHVSLEEGPVAGVIPHLWNMFRRTHPGVQLIPGAIYYHGDGRWLWITCQRPNVGMQWEFDSDSQKAQFQYHARLAPAEIVHTPEVSLYWGHGGKPEMFACLNDAFIVYEEPPEWFYHTCWHWIHWWGYRPGGYTDMAEQAEYLHEKIGLTGFGLTSHDLRPGSWDCSASGLRPSPHIGGESGIRKFSQRVRSFGGRIFIWVPWLGLGEPSLDLRDNWRIKGEDGRPYESYAIGSYDMYHALNFNHPEVQEYYLGWIKRYLTEYQIDGIFWDCGGAPLPPDFSPRKTRPFQRFPSESMTGGYKFMEKVMQIGRGCSRDFFMWHECFSTDLPGHGYGSALGQDRFIFNLNRYGKKRLVYRSNSLYNLYGGFPFVNPCADTAFGSSTVTLEHYKAMAKDRMNQWLVKFVKENGVRKAVGIDIGVAWCASHLVVDPGKNEREVTIPEWIGRVRKLTNVFSGETVDPLKQKDEGVVFKLESGTAYVIEK